MEGSPPPQSSAMEGVVSTAEPQTLPTQTPSAPEMQSIRPLPPPAGAILRPPPPPMLRPPPPPIAPVPPPPSFVRSLAEDAKPSPSEDSDSDGDEEEEDDTSQADFEMTEDSRKARERHELALQELQLRRRAYALAVPTNDSAVRALLRRLGEPVTFFGEREMERRDRLRSLMAKLDADGQLDKVYKARQDEDAASASTTLDDHPDYDAPQAYPFYTEGTQELYNARLEIAKFSLPRAAARLQRAKRRRDDPDEDEDEELNYVLKQVSSVVMDCSEIGDDRPLSGCSFSRDGSLLATSAWSGLTKIWSIPEVKKVATLKGHTERVTDVTFSCINDHLATASADHTAMLWNSEGTLLKTFKGHLDRLARISFHPSGLYLGTASFDKTWRLWDVNVGTELLLQEGHSRSLYGIAFHPDGSLAATCGLDALARVWDLRTGRSILALEGHVKPVLGIDFSPNGYHLATGGEDHSCRIWDLRKRQCIYTIPAHSHLISQVKYEPQEGYFLATASYDNTARVWSGRDFKPANVLSGHEAKVTSIDISADGQYVATVSHDRTIKLWSTKSNGKADNMNID